MKSGTSTTVWVIDDDQSIRWVLEKALSKAGFSPHCFESAILAIQALENTQQKDLPGALLTDVRMPDMDGFEFLDQLQQQHPEIPVIIMTAHADLDSAVTTYQSGAFEYLPKPFDIDEVVALTQRACDSRASIIDEESNEEKETRILGKSLAMQEVFRAIGRLSQTNINVLINGESGTGKELVAQALHDHSERASQPFIALNTAAIPHDLIESELFGHEKGAFTGAHSQRKGRFEKADGGTLFLDEIGDMPANLQTRLLRVLAEGVFYRVGGHQPIQVDTRIIAATHQNLETLVKQGQFREDLFHRLNVVRIKIPPLRERRDDIKLLTEQFIKKIARDLKEIPKTISTEAMNELCAADWPGNVRQLENACRSMLIMSVGNEILSADLPEEVSQINTNPNISQNWQTLFQQTIEQQLKSGKTDLFKNTLPEIEKTLITTALTHTKGHRQEAAQLLGIGRNTLTRRIKELDIQ